jgi:Ras family
MCMFAANKADLSDQRVVTEEEGREAAEKHNVALYCETSAKTNKGIDGVYCARWARCHSAAGERGGGGWVLCGGPRLCDQTIMNVPFSSQIASSSYALKSRVRRLHSLHKRTL